MLLDCNECKQASDVNLLDCCCQFVSNFHTMTGVQCCVVVAGGPPGDLIVKTKVKQHNELRREQLTIHSDVAVSYVDAILGMLVLSVQTLISILVAA